MDTGSLEGGVGERARACCRLVTEDGEPGLLIRSFLRLEVADREEVHGQARPHYHHQQQQRPAATTTTTTKTSTTTTTAHFFPSLTDSPTYRRASAARHPPRAHPPPTYPPQPAPQAKFRSADAWGQPRVCLNPPPIPMRTCLPDHETYLSPCLTNYFHTCTLVHPHCLCKRTCAHANTRTHPHPHPHSHPLAGMQAHAVTRVRVRACRPRLGRRPRSWSVSWPQRSSGRPR
jgi:hypothetical protein